MTRSSPPPSMPWRGNLRWPRRAGSRPRRMPCGAAGRTPSRSSSIWSAMYSASWGARATTWKASPLLPKSARRASRGASVSRDTAASVSPDSAARVLVAAGSADALALARSAVQSMYRTDRASQNLGLEILDVAPGSVRISMTVRPEMVNGHGLCHGGIIFTLADSAFAFACNSHGEPMVAAGASIEFLAPTRAGELLTATATEVSRSARHGVYDVRVSLSSGETVALFRGRSARLRPPTPNGTTS